MRLRREGAENLLILKIKLVVLRVSNILCPRVRTLTLPLHVIFALTLREGNTVGP